MRSLLSSPNVARLFLATVAMASIIFGGGLLLVWLGGGAWSVWDGAYMAVISATTVGFSELPHFESVTGARLATVIIIIAGVGAVTYLQSALTAFFVEGTLGQLFRRRRMERAIAQLSGHVVVAGAGSTGRHVIEELVATNTPYVVIDTDQAHLERANEEVAQGRLLYVVGDATEDHTLHEAGIDRASGVIAALTHDRDNLYVTISARTLNAKARIVAKVVEPEARPKMLRAGANATVSPTTIGGMRLASELLRPTVVEFLDTMLRQEGAFRFSEIDVPAGSPLVGRTLRELPLRGESNVLVVAVRGPDRKLTYNPGAEHAVKEGETLVVLGDVPQVRRVQAAFTAT